AIAEPARQPPQILILLAGRLKAQKDAAVAADLLRGAVREHPRDFWLLFTLGNLTPESAERIAWYSAALAARPDSAITRHNLARSLLERGDAPGGAVEFRKAIELDRDYAPAHDGLGVVLLTQKEYRRALDVCHTALAIAPTTRREGNVRYTGARAAVL